MATGDETIWAEDERNEMLADACADADQRRLLNREAAELLDSRSRHDGLVQALREIEAAMRKVAGDPMMRLVKEET